MALSHVLQHAVTVENTSFATVSETVTGATRLSLNRDSNKGGVIVPIGVNTHITDVAITVADVKSFMMTSDQALTVKTNSSGSPDNTIALLPNIPYVWTTNSYESFLLTTNVVSIYVTCTVAANFSLEALIG